MPRSAKWRKMGSSSPLLAFGKVHRARVAVCAARTPGVGHFAPAHAVTAAPTKTVGHIALALRRSSTPVIERFSSHWCWSTSSQPLPCAAPVASGEVHRACSWSQLLRQWQSSSRQCLQRPVAPAPAMCATASASASAHLAMSCRMRCASAISVRSASACG